MTKVSHYRILEQVGQGGMGVVYKARDTKLDRLVALKFLPPHMSSDPDAKARFIREAKAASALDHPNICTIHEIDEAEDGRLYIVMPFYEGETLKSRLDKGPLAVEMAVSIASQVGLGLERAHESGIVHRDIKPANVMLTDRDEVKILDFGIAKLENGAGITRTGDTLGTVAYMCPEQIAGGNTDPRCDLWSVGVILYEMVVGTRPFVGEYDQAVLYAIVNKEPVPADAANPAVPEDLARIVTKLLAKNPNDRIQTAAELVAALRGIRTADEKEPPRKRNAFRLGKTVWYGVAVALIVITGLVVLRSTGGESDALETEASDAGVVDRPTLAVLPFANMRPDDKTDFLGYALADQVIGSLTYVKDLTVRPASSVRQYQGGQYEVQRAGKSLGADYVLAGNYLQQQDRMRLTVELVDVDTRDMVWREPIDLEYKDVFAMQDLVAERLLKRLQVQFSEAERSRMNADVPSDPVAYEYYLRALSHAEDREGNALAIDLLEQAIALDSTFAPAWNELGSRLRTKGYWDMGGQAVSKRAEACFEKALELNPDLLSALSNVALYFAETGELDRAYEAAERVLEINANQAEGHFARGYVLRYAGLIDESVAEMRRALAADSTNPTFRSAGFTFITSRDYDDMAAAFRLSRIPGLAEAWKGEVLRRQGQVEAARRELQKARDLDPSGITGLWAEGVLAGIDADYERGIEAARTWEQANVLDGEGWYFLGALYCFNRDYRKCLDLLSRAVEMGYYNYRMYERDPFLDAVRDRPAYRALVTRAKAESDAFRERHRAGGAR